MELHRQAPDGVTSICHFRNVTLVNDQADASECSALCRNIDVLQEIFPDLTLELVEREGRFGPDIIDSISQEFGVPKNNIFIGAPEQKHSFSVQDLGGVRVIF